MKGQESSFCFFVLHEFTSYGASRRWLTQKGYSLQLNLLQFTH
ncbi:unnamed protein product [Brassica rapa]|uniref:Uncharacterized protein n=1 Tax=Brassica campestris TaxID=3711 RepID=A0A8D9LS89_BRACM|nr:unnamed protein product [Brassica rapa]